jgi:hypothetical protein
MMASSTSQRTYSDVSGQTAAIPNSDMTMLKDGRNFLTHYGDHKGLSRDFLWSPEIFVLKE